MIWRPVDVAAWVRLQASESLLNVAVEPQEPGSQLALWGVNRTDWLAYKRAHAAGPKTIAKLLIDEAQGRTETHLLDGITVKEFVFELVRSQEFRGLPSRLGSAHVFRTLKAAIRFADERCTGAKCWLYECALGPGARRFDGSAEWLGMETKVPRPPASATLAEVGEFVVEAENVAKDYARRYWGGQVAADSNPLFAESLVEGPAIARTLVAIRF